MVRDIISRYSGDIMSALSLEETLHRNQEKDVNIPSDAPNPLVTHYFPEKIRDNALIKMIPEIKLVFQYMYKMWSPGQSLHFSIKFLKVTYQLFC